MKRYVNNQMNRKRQRWALGALDAFSIVVMGNRSFKKLNAEEQFFLISDLFCDLMHVCASKGIDYKVMLNHGRRNFEIERDGREF